jgi:hypothetical protein
MRGFVDYNVTVGVVGLVRGPSNVRKVSCDAVAFHLSIIWREPISSNKAQRIRHADPVKQVDNSASIAALAP